MRFFWKPSSTFVEGRDLAKSLVKGAGGSLRETQRAIWALRVPVVPELPAKALIRMRSCDRRRRVTAKVIATKTVACERLSRSHELGSPISWLCVTVRNVVAHTIGPAHTQTC